MSEKQRLIITNNPMVKANQLSASVFNNHKLFWVEGKTEDVLKVVRNHCHRQHQLITHPLTGSIKPNQTPYKTVIVEPTDNRAVDHQSVIMAETSLAKAHDLLKLKPRPNLAESVNHDFAMIDYSLFQSYLETLN